MARKKKESSKEIVKVEPTRPASSFEALEGFPVYFNDQFISNR